MGSNGDDPVLGRLSTLWTPKSPYCDGGTKSRLQIRGQIPCKYPPHQILNISATATAGVFLIWQLAHWQQISTKFRFSVWENFLLFVKEAAGQGLSRWLIIQRWRHFPRPAEFITNHKIGSQDVYERYKVQSTFGFDLWTVKHKKQ